MLLVVNVDDPGSLAVANHFIHLRGIPFNNVVYLDQVPAGRVASFELFRERIGDRIVEAFLRRVPS